MRKVNRRKQMVQKVKNDRQNDYLSRHRQVEVKTRMKGAAYLKPRQ